MHWLSIVGILLVAAGTFCTYWGTELRQRGGGQVAQDNAAQEQLEELRAEQQALLEQAKLIGQENDRLRADNTTLTLKFKRAEEDAEVYKYRADELKNRLDEQRGTLEHSEMANKEDVPNEPAAEAAVSTGWGDAPPTGQRPPERPPERSSVRDTESEMEIIERLRELTEARDYKALETEAAEQVENNPDWMTPYVYLGVAERHLGKRREALSHFVHVVENGPADPAYPQAERALKLMTTGIQDLAEKNEWGQLAAAAEKQITQDPDWHLPYYFGGLAYTHLGQKEKAMEFLQKFIESSDGDPEYGKAVRALRLLQTNILDLQRQGDYPALIQACVREIENDPDWSTPHYLLGLAFARLGNTARARDHLETFIARAPDDPDYNNARRLLESMK
jgi:tetratricopeptide (TPR) repeat protein